MDLVVKDDKLDSEQKQAMLQGFRRLEAGEIFKVLTPEQQKEVRKRLTAQRAAGQQQRKAQQQPMVLPH
jgi:Spy/CpxP family protein refolding chaperone